MMLTKASTNVAHECGVFHPASVAVIGASDNRNKVGGRPIYYMKRFGYAGRILPINPQRHEVQGLRCFSSLSALDEVPDAAIIAVSGQSAIDAVHECALIGVETVIIMASGFAETGAEGRVLQDDLIRHARSHGMRVVGPNAQGIANFATGAVLNFSTMFMEVEPMDGAIAIVSQSGAASVMPYALLRGQGLGVRYLAATGNDADLGVSELTKIIASDEDIRLILVYVEAVSHPSLLAEAAQIAHSRGAQIVLLKGGSSSHGAAAAASHTGALVGADGALDAFLRQNGIIRVADIHGLVNAAPHYVKHYPPGNGRTIVMSHSGAVGVMCADAADRAGLPLAQLGEATLAAVREVMPSFASASNPLDLTASLLGNGDMFPKVLDALGNDPEADMFVIGIPVAGPGYDVDALARTTANFMLSHRKPIAVTAPQASVREKFDALGIPTYVSETDAINGLSQYASPRHVAPVLQQDVRSSLGVDRFGLCDEADSLTLLQRCGVPVVKHAVCQSVDEALEAASRLGARCVVKGCAAQIPHKSEHDLVKIGVTGPEQVRAAATECLAILEKLGVADPRVILAEMETGRHEFMLGVSVDPVFGPIVLIGEGGTLAELRNDHVSLPVPFGIDEALAAIGTLRVAPVFGGLRGQPALDKYALAQAAVCLGDFAMSAGEALVSVDLNPVLVKAEGAGVVAVDAVVQFKERDHV